MTIVKKVAVKKIPAPVVIKKKVYEDYLNDESYSTIEELVKENLPIGDETEVDVKLDRNCKLKYMEQHLPYCCGILELGGIQIANPDTSELTKYFDLLVAFTKNKTLIINTNGRGSSITMEKALVKCKNWTAVKKFVNRSSRNTITMWVSNND